MRVRLRAALPSSKKSSYLLLEVLACHAFYVPRSKVHYDLATQIQIHPNGVSCIIIIIHNNNNNNNNT